MFSDTAKSYLLILLMGKLVNLAAVGGPFTLLPYCDNNIDLTLGRKIHIFLKTLSYQGSIRRLYANYLQDLIFYNFIFIFIRHLNKLL